MNDSKEGETEEGYAEFGVDSRYRSEKEKRDDGKTLMVERLERMKNLTEEEIRKARKMQLKLKESL